MGKVTIRHWGLMRGIAVGFVGLLLQTGSARAQDAASDAGVSVEAGIVIDAGSDLDGGSAIGATPDAAAFGDASVDFDAGTVSDAAVFEPGPEVSQHGCDAGFECECPDAPPDCFDAPSEEDPSPEEIPPSIGGNGGSQSYVLADEYSDEGCGCNVAKQRPSALGGFVALTLLLFARRRSRQSTIV